MGKSKLLKCMPGLHRTHLHLLSDLTYGIAIVIRSLERLRLCGAEQQMT